MYQSVSNYVLSIHDCCRILSSDSNSLESCSVFPISYIIIMLVSIPY